MLKLCVYLRLVVVLVCAFTVVAQADVGLVPIQIEHNGKVIASFSVEIANTQRKRARGLMDRDALPVGQGMLFVFEKPLIIRMWMDRTRIPLDMVFIDAAGVVQYVHKNARPYDRTVISKPIENIAVLEVSGGVSEALGIAVGDVVSSKEVDVFKKTP